MTKPGWVLFGAWGALAAILASPQAREAVERRRRRTALTNFVDDLTEQYGPPDEAVVAQVAEKFREATKGRRA